MRAQTFIAHLPYNALSKSESSPFEIMWFTHGSSTTVAESDINILQSDPPQTLSALSPFWDQTSSSSSTWRKATTTFAAASHFMDERLPSCEATTATPPGKRRHVTAADW